MGGVTLGWKANSTAGSTVTITLTPSATGTVAADAVTAYPMAVTTKVNYLYADHLNTPRVITRATDNKMLWRWDNTDPFGVIPPNDNPAGLGLFTYNPRFPGQTYDKETGLNYNGHRSYDPATGRYTQSDPIGLQGGINTYAYVNGNPVNYTDPSGLLCLAGIDEACNINTPGAMGPLGLGPNSCMADDGSSCPYDDPRAITPTDILPYVAGAGLALGTDGLAGLVARSLIKRCPKKALDILDHIRAKGSPPKGYKGGRNFANDGRGGGEVLPKTDANGNPVNYTEYDVNPFQKGVNRGSERLVVGSDGNSYYTSDHYSTYIPIK